MLLPRDEHVVSALFKAQTQAAETVGDNAQVLPRDVLDGQFASRHGGHADETAHLNHVGQDAVVSAVQLVYALDGQQVGGDACDACPHLVEHSAQLLHIGLACRVIDGCRALCHHSCHHNVGSARHRGLVKQHVGPVQPAFAPKSIGFLFSVKNKFSPQVADAPEVGVEAAATNLVSAGIGKVHHAQATQQRPYQQHRATQFGAFVHEVLTLDELGVDVFGFETIGAVAFMLHSDAHVLEQVYQVVHVHNVGDVVDDHLLASEQACTDDLQCFVLGSLGRDFSMQGMVPFNDK